MRLRSRSIATRWALRYGLVSALALVALYAFVHDRVDRLVRRDAQDMLHLELDRASPRPDESLAEREERLRADLRGADPDYKLAIAIYDAQGRPLFAQGHPRSLRASLPELPPGAGREFRELDLGSKYPYWTVARAQGDEIHQVTLYGRRFIRRGYRMEYAFLSVLPVAALGLLGVGLAMSRSVLQPVRRMVEAIRGMGARNLDARLTVSGTGDELDRIAESFNALMDRLQASFTTLRQFTGDVAHQLRGPITALRARIEVALREQPLPADAQSVLEALLADVARLSEVNDAMLRLSRYTAGIDPRQRTRVELAEIVAAVAEFLEPLASERGIRLESVLDAAPAVLGDASWLRQLLVNLAENALEHTSEGGRIRLALEASGDEAVVRVSDSGSGIPVGQRERVFERFWRAPSEAGPGMGLGLAIAREIALVHDGSLAISGEPGQGATFTLRLPALVPSAAGTTAAAQASPGLSRSRVRWSSARLRQ